MKDSTGELRSCKPMRSNKSVSWRKLSRCHCVRFYWALLCYGALALGGALHVHRPFWQGSLFNSVASLLQADPVHAAVGCGYGPLNAQEIYEAYRRNHANLRIKLLSEEDGAPFLQSRQPPRPREITIVTQATVDRWPQLEKMATSWGGALCVAVYVKTRAEIVPTRNMMMRLHDRIEAQSHCRLHMQMVVEEGFRSENDALSASYPVNALRNVALGMAKTQLVFLLDVDFVTSPGLHEKLTASEKVYSDLIARTTKRRQLLVVPAFQVHPVVPQGIHPGTIPLVEEPIPQSMQELRERWENGSITQFHWFHPASHNSTIYSHFLNPLTTEPYDVAYREPYEPYIIGARALVPKFDESFRGYGKNKIAHAYTCAAEGFSFVVLPGVYVWEVPHRKSISYRQFREKQDDPCAIDVMDVVYNVFKKELRGNIQPLST